METEGKSWKLTLGREYRGQEGTKKGSGIRRGKKGRRPTCQCHINMGVTRWVRGGMRSGRSDA